MSWPRHVPATWFPLFSAALRAVSVRARADRPRKETRARNPRKEEKEEGGAAAPRAVSGEGRARSPLRPLPAFPPSSLSVSRFFPPLAKGAAHQLLSLYSGFRTAATASPLLLLAPHCIEATRFRTSQPLCRYLVRRNVDARDRSASRVYVVDEVIGDNHDSGMFSRPWISFSEIYSQQQQQHPSKGIRKGSPRVG